jgi:hypothetical protein
MTESVAQIRNNEPPPSSEGLQRELHDLAFEQAQRDFEIANGRARDLTLRLVETQENITNLRNEIGQLRAEYADLEAVHNAMRASKGFQLASRIWAIRNALKI